MKSTWKVFLGFTLLTAAIASAGVIVVGLDDSTALAQYTAARNGFTVNEAPDITTGQITLAARFNPDASQSTAGPVVVIEDGGTSNGTGLYLAGGNLVFMAKGGDGRYALPTSLSDTDFTAGTGGKAMAVSLGAINFGVENKVYVSMDLKGGKLFASVNGVTSSYIITGASGTENLDGNRSISFLGVTPLDNPSTPATNEFGWLGGLLEEGNGNNASTLYPQLFWTNAVAMIQTDGYNNQLGQVFSTYIPEPATLLLLGLGAAALRRRN
jgi:hypothetical protein